jgi:hypothetical protein
VARTKTLTQVAGYVMPEFLKKTGARNVFFVKINGWQIGEKEVKQ